MSIRFVGFILAGLIVLIFAVRFAMARMMSSGGAPPGAVQKAVTSKDGTVIAYEQTGAGPVLILVSAALVDRDGTRLLARELATSFTLINYDRRGRGQSGNTEPYSPIREIEDLEALAGMFDEPIYFFGSSSGAVLALDAASRLGPKVRKAFLYEPPFIVDAGRPAIPESLAQEVAAAVAANKRDAAVGIFFREAMGIPSIGVTFMRLLMPPWKDMVRMVHTAPYDLMVLAGTQSGKRLPTDRWAPSTAPILVTVGAKSEPFFHTGAQSLKGILPTAQYRSLAGLDHGAVLMAPKDLAAAIKEFFGQTQ
jgi:pimeloyl-ACP methyl ester carboxylesterase